MWTLITGNLLSSIFENQTVKLFEDSFSNKELTLTGIIVGWFFQEFTTEKYGIPGGKNFMIDYDYRYRTIIQMVLITKKFLFFIHLVFFLEFGTFLIIIGLYFVISKKFASFSVKTIKIKIKQAIFFMTNILRDIDLPGFKISRVWSFWTWSFNDTVLFCCMFFLFKYGFFKVYSWKDFLFITRPVLYLIFFSFVFYSMFLLCYLAYLCFIHILIINIALILKAITKKSLVYFFYLSVLIGLVVSDIEVENLTNENFFKEIFFKVLLFLI
jgi:hypothetical protein